MKKIVMGALVCAGVVGMAVSCGRSTPKTDAATTAATTDSVVLKDYGANPTVLNIEDYTLANENFRTVIWTGNSLQVTVMSIPVGGDVGLELHPDIDQFLRIEQGTGRAMMGDARDSLTFVRDVTDGSAVFVPAGKWHNIVNTGDIPLKIYSIYAPVEHPFGTIHRTQQDAIEAEAHE